MTTDGIILHIFCLVDDHLPDIPRHPQAKLYPSELVTIGILFALRGGSFRAFYRWLKSNYGDWFGDGTLLERTRLQRLLKTHQDWCQWLMAEPTSLPSLTTIRLNSSFRFAKAAVHSKWAKRAKIKVAGVSASSCAG